MIPHDSMDRRVAELVDLACDECLSAAELGELDTILSEDPKARQYYVEQVELHTNLYFSMAAKAAGERAVAGRRLPARPTQRARWPMALVLAVAASLVLGFWLVRRDAAVPGGGAPLAAQAPVVATLHDSVAAVMRTAAGQPVTLGDLRGGSYVLDSGLAEIRFADGTAALLEGPSRFALVDDDSLELERGQVHVRVQDGGTGFQVRSGGLEVTDLGTEFGVLAADEDYAEVHVFDGVVLVRTVDDDGLGRDSMRLEEGSAVRVFRRSALVSGTDLSEHKFVRTLHSPESEYERLVLSMAPSVYYPMTPQGDGLQIVDRVGAAHGQMKMPPVGGSPWASGKFGHALRFADPLDNSFVSVPAFPRPDGDVISCAAWVFAESRPTWAMIAGNWEMERYGLFHFGLHERTGKLDIELTSSRTATAKGPGAGRLHATEDAPFPLGSWQHVAFVADGNEVRLYRNGEVVAHQTYGGFHNVDEELKVLSIGAKLNAAGSAPAPTGNFWHGRIDELAIFDHALSGDQIRQLYEAGEN